MLWPKSCFEVGSSAVLHQRGEKHVGVEEIDAHGGVNHGGIEGRAEIGGLWLLMKADDLAGAGYFDDAEAR